MRILSVAQEPSIDLALFGPLLLFGRLGCRLRLVSLLRQRPDVPLLGRTGRSRRRPVFLRFPGAGGEMVVPGGRGHPAALSTVLLASQVVGRRHQESVRDVRRQRLYVSSSYRTAPPSAPASVARTPYAFR